MKVLTVTGSRSDYSLMSKLLRLLSADVAIEHHLFVTGMLLEPDHADVLEKIRADGFGKLHEAKTFEGGQDSAAMSKALGCTIAAVTEVLSDVHPDYLVLQGDRGEMLAAAIAAAHLNIPIVHLSGGDRSGSIDDSIRNAISKFAHLHLTTCDDSSRRLLQMGETDWRVVNVGEPGLDVLLDTPLMSRAEVESEFRLGSGEAFILACQHPVTTETNRAGEQIEMTLAALQASGLKVIMTYPNNDAGSDKIIAALEKRRGETWIHVVKNLGSRRFLSLLKYSSALVGNSSSGIWEAPSFQKPVVNIGTRQHGRMRAGNVLDVAFNYDEILLAIRRSLTDQSFLQSMSKVRNPYGDGRSSERIVELLKKFERPQAFIAKWMDDS